MRPPELSHPEPPTRPRTAVPLAWAGALALIALHNDAWVAGLLPEPLGREARATLWLDWLPGELGYRLAWMLLAWLYLAWFCRVIWRSPAEEHA
jgi:hypothetical protein